VNEGNLKLCGLGMCCRLQVAGFGFQTDFGAWCGKLRWERGRPGGTELFTHKCYSPARRRRRRSRAGFLLFVWA
jgi:hypothetical protein